MHQHKKIFASMLGVLLMTGSMTSFASNVDLDRRVDRDPADLLDVDQSGIRLLDGVTRETLSP